MNYFRKTISYKYSVIIIVVLIVLAVGGVAFKNAREGRLDNASNESTQTPTEASDSAKISKQEDSEKEDSNKKEATTKESSTTTSETIEDTTSDGSSSNGGSTSQPPPMSGKTVTISSSGFSPPSVTISAGETIEWVNNDNRSHWPASNPHPQHTNYSGFDSFGISAGSSWSFKFNNKGTWGYHDHQFPSKSGTIIVN